MAISEKPFHQSFIVKALPAWSKHLPASHAGSLLKVLRKGYLDEDGRPYSWYATASSARQIELLATIEERDRSRQVYATALAPLQGITAFCEPLLSAALNIAQPVTRAQYVFQPWQLVVDEDLIGLPSPGPLPGDIAPSIPQADGPPQLHSLLAAALNNFVDHAQPGPLSYLRHSASNPAPLAGLDLASFVTTCRSLDLGEKYQQHLRDVFEGPHQAVIERLHVQASRDELLVHAHIARMQGLVSEAGHGMLVQLCEDAGEVYYAGRPASVQWLELFDTPIHEVLVIGPQDTDQTNPCVLYVPGRDEECIREFASATEVHRYLRSHLRESGLRRLFIGYADTPLQPEMAQRLQGALFERLDDGRLKPLVDPKVQITSREVSGPVWQRLYRNHLQRLKGNARAVAVPTADVDAAERLRQLEHWAEIGMDVLNAAALVVPGLNVPMLALFGAQIMGEVFHGIESWEHDDHAGALAHVESLLLDALTVGALAFAGKALKSSGFVDAMEQIWVDGKNQLWSPDLKGYEGRPQTELTGQPDSQGLYRLGNKQYVIMNDKPYEVYADDQGQWRIKHPSDADAYNPRLLHDGQGAWRAQYDWPMKWSRTQILRRIGHLTDGLDDAELLEVAQTVGISRGALVRTHLLSKPAPSLLVDALVRLRCDKDTASIIESVRKGTPMAAHLNFAAAELPNLPGWAHEVRVKLYQGPEPWGEAILYGNDTGTPGLTLEVTRTQLEQGELASVIVSQLDEQSLIDLLGSDTPPAEHAQALQNLLADHLLGKRGEIFDMLYDKHEPVVGAEASRLAQQFPGLPKRVLEEIVNHASVNDRAQLRSADGKVPLRVLEEARRLQARLRLDRALMGLYRPGLANLDTQLLSDAMAARSPALAGNTAEYLKVLGSDRSLAGTLLGQQPIRPRFRSPLRLSDGRIGYRLSGRGSWFGTSTTMRRLRSLYPGLGTQELSTLRATLNGLPGSLSDHVAALETQWWALDEGLNEWALEAEGEQRQNREAFGTAMRTAWRRESGDTLTVAHMRLDALPQLPAQMDHITSIVLQNAGVEQVPATFLQAFPNVRSFSCVQNVGLNSESLFTALRNARHLQELELRSNQLQRLPDNALPALASLPRLRRLDLRNNALQLSETQWRALSRLPLEELDLHANALTLDDTTSAWINDMVNLRELNLGGNPLRVAPQLGYLARLELLNLARAQLNHWPSGLTTLMSQRNFQLRRVDLSDNQITTLPTLDDILATPYAQAVAAQRQDLRWHFNYNELEQTAALRLRQIGLGVFEYPPTSDTEPENEPISWRGRASEQQQQQWDQLFADQGNTPLEDVLQRLTFSADARQDARGMTSRVWKLLQHAIDDDALRQRLVELAREYPATCGDAGSDAFSALELEIQAYELGQSTETSGWDLYLFYRRLYLRDRVNQAADRISLRRQLRRAALAANADNLPPLDTADDIDDENLRNIPVDDIEIRLALRQALSTPDMLDFPEPSRGMLYRATAMLNDEIEENVREQISQAVSEALRQEWIMAQPGWRLYLGRERAADLRSFEDSWGRGLNYLTGLYEPSDGRLEDDVATAIRNAIGSAPYDANGAYLPLPDDANPPAEAITSYTAERQHAEGVLYRRLTTEQAVLPSR